MNRPRNEWMNQVVRAFVVVPAVALSHVATISAVVFWAFGSSLHNFERETDPSMWDQVANRMVAVLMFPMGQVIEQRGYTSPHSGLLWAATSLIWGLGAFLLIESRRMLRFRAS
jgi:hypothetical protein